MLHLSSSSWNLAIIINVAKDTTYTYVSIYVYSERMEKRRRGKNEIIILFKYRISDFVLKEMKIYI